jgi:sarcosine oxidase subunit beta
VGQTQDVIIIGGGISGTAAAYELAKRGARVTLVERGDLHSMASGWTLAGVRQSGRHPAELPLAKAAVRRWEHLSEELGSDVEYRQQGNLRLALSDDEVPAIQQVIDEGNAAGIPMEYVDGSHAVREISSAITADVVGASFCPTDGHANNHLTVQAYARAAQRHGTDIRTGTDVLSLILEGERVTGVHTANGPLHADVVIVAAGIYTPHLLTPLGLDLPLQVVLCPVFTTESTVHVLGPVLGVASGGFAGRQEASGRFRLIGESLPWDGEHHTETNTMPTAIQAEQMIAGAMKILPGVRELRINRMWGGLIDRTPDVIPVIDRVPGWEGLIIAAGFSGHGFGIGPATGEILADLVTAGTTEHAIDAFRLNRFATGVTQEALQMHG